MSERIVITSLTSEGEGIGSQNGFKIFVENALPGETVDVTITSRHKNYARASIDRIVKSSPDRLQPICPLFGSCGGCQIMHLNYQNQLEAKRQRIVDAMTRIAHLKAVVVQPCLPSPKALHYRNKIQLPVQGKELGLYKKNSHDIIPHKKCFIHCHEGEEILEKLRQLLPIPSLLYLTIKNTSLESLVILITDGSEPNLVKQFAEQIVLLSPRIKGVVEMINQNDDSVIFTSKFKTLIGSSHIFETLHAKKFRISVSSFFQVNTLQAQNLVSYCMEETFIENTDVVLDAYCGVGTFSLFAAEKAKHVIGCEISPSAIFDAQENAKLNKMFNTSFFVGKAEELMINLQSFNIAILNPPRKGCDTHLIDQLIVRKPEKIIYISCDPATLARDVRRLHEEGNYQIFKIQPFDMFPQTMHVETIVTLKLGTS